MVKVTGAQLKAMLRYMMRDEVWEGVHSEFYQLSEGLHVVYDRASHAYKEFTFEGAEVTDGQMFTLGLQNFHFKNFKDIFNIDLAEVEANMKPRIIATSCRGVLEEYLSERQHLDHQNGERLAVL